MQTIGHHEDDQEQFEIIRWISKILAPRSTLEIGCGHKRFQVLFPHYIGLDSDYTVYPDVVEDAKDMSCFGDKQFDLVLSVTVLMHNRDVEEIEKEMARVADRYIVLIETTRWIGKARAHKYEFPDFEQQINLQLRTNDSPLALWVFQRKGR